MKSILLVGLGKFGFMLAANLNEEGHEIMAVDRNEKRVREALPYVTNAEIGDSTEREFLESLGVKNYDVCFVTISEDFQSSLETTSLLDELGAKMVVSRAESEVQKKFLLRNGADAVIDPEQQAANWAAVRYTSSNVLDYIELDEEHAIYEVEVPDNWIGERIGSLDIRKKYGINILAVKEEGGLDLSVTPETELRYGQSLLVLGENRDIRKCFRIVD